MWYPYEFVGLASGTVYGPLVEFEILAPNQPPFTTMGLIDSGAHTTLLDIAIANDLKLPVRRKTNLDQASTADGQNIKVYRFPVEARFNGVTFQLNACWTRLSDPETKEVNGVNLLGREDFFSNFMVMFKQERVLIRPNPQRKRWFFPKF